MPIFSYGKIKPLRQAKGLNQTEIAAELGISRPTYVLMEQGEKEPTMSQLYTLARLLGVEAGELCSNLPGSATAFDYPIFKELVFACISRGAQGGTITKTKLSILLYLVDFSWYRMDGSVLSGATYRNSPRGPVADAYLQAIDELYEGQAVALEPHGTALNIRVLEQRSSKLLSREQLSLVQKVCTKWQPESTETIINFVREQQPSRTTKSGTPIPYETVLNEPLDSLY